jgi:hypothetical protein
MTIANAVQAMRYRRGAPSRNTRSSPIAAKMAIANCAM